MDVTQPPEQREDVWCVAVVNLGVKQALGGPAMVTHTPVGGLGGMPTAIYHREQGPGIVGLLISISLP